MIVDGRVLAQTVLQDVAFRVATYPSAPTLSALTCAPDAPTQQYLRMKKRRAAEVGMAMNVVELPANATTEMCIASIESLLPQSTGVVVQLPLPTAVDTTAVLAAVPPTHDPDGFAYGHDPAACLSPVVAAIDEIARAHHVTFAGASVVVLGEGRLVGQPAAIYARAAGAKVTVLNATTFTPALVQAADIIISGIGQPHFLTPALIKPGAVVFDAGTSEDGGELRGDVDPTVAEIASLLTPVPGGIGPLTIACLLRNVCDLGER